MTTPINPLLTNTPTPAFGSLMSPYLISAHGRATPAYIFRDRAIVNPTAIAIITAHGSDVIHPGC